jgi:LysM repeat protein
LNQARSDEGSVPSRKRARYHLSMPVSLHEELQVIADEEQVSIAEIMRRFLKLGVVASKLGQSQDAHLCIANGDTIQQIIVL